MAGWCLTKQAEANLLKALREDGDPQKMVDRGTEGRRSWFAKVAGEENATQLNTLFEKRMLLKNQQKAFEGFIKQLNGRPEVKRDFLSKVQRLDTALSKTEVKQFLGDLVSQRLGTTVSESEFKTISEMSKKIADLQTNFDPNGDPARQMGTWKSETAANEHGALQRAFENYVSDLKSGKESIAQMLKGRGSQFKNEFVKNPILATGKLIIDSAHTISENALTVVANWDESLYGRQAFPVVLTGHPILWIKGLIKGVSDSIKALGGKETTDALMAKIYSDPLYMNGEYKIAGILGSFEEQRPTAIPERIPGIGRIFKAADQAFNNGSLYFRTELYKMMRNSKVDMGIKMTNEEIKATGKIVNSILARGALGKIGENPIIRLFLWAPRMLKADLDLLTAHVFDKDIRFLHKDSRVAIGNLIKIVTITAIISTLLNINNPKSVELDPRSSDFLKPYGKFGYLRGMPQLITLAARMLTGQYKDNKGQIVNYAPGIGKRSRMDALISFLRGKAPPATGAVYDWLAGQDYNGNPPTFSSVLLQRGIPISIQNLLQLRKDPTLDNAMGVVADFFGFNANLNPQPNIKSKIIPEGQPQKSGDIINFVQTYAEAFSTDPETAFNRAFTGQKIIRTENGAIIVERMSLHDSQALKKKYGANTKQVKLDHTIPLEIGGSNDISNLKLVSTSDWASYTPVEDTLGRALKAGKISKSEAQTIIKKFKSISDSKARKAYGQNVINRYR